MEYSRHGFDLTEERILRRIPAEILVLSGVLALGSAFVFDWLTAVILFAGGGLAAASFFWLKQALTRLILQGKTKAVRLGIVFYLLRLLLIAGSFFIIILFFSKKILAFAAGFSTIILVFLAEGVIAFSRMKQWKS